MYLIHNMGVMYCTLFEHGLKGGLKYTLWVKNYVNGGYGGDINARWNVWASSLGLGIFCWFGSFVAWLCELFLCSVMVAQRFGG